MDIKEFRSNEAAKTEQQPAYTDGSANGSVNYKVYALIGIIAALIVIIIAVFIKANKFDIKEYIKPV